MQDLDPEYRFILFLVGIGLAALLLGALIDKFNPDVVCNASESAHAQK